MSVLIALTGAHGTGKTTLCDALSLSLQGRGSVSICREAPRLVTDAVGDPGFFRRGRNTPERQMLIFLYHVIEEQGEDRRTDFVLSDRTLMDHLAYTVALFPEFEATPECDALRRAAVASLARYDLIFKLPVEFPPEDDGVREADAGFQATIDRIIDKLFAEAGVQPTRIAGSVRQRVDAVLLALEEATATQLPP